MILTVVIGLILGLLVAGGLVTAYHLQHAPEGEETEEGFQSRALPRQQNLLGAVRVVEVSPPAAASAPAVPELVVHTVRPSSAPSLKILQTLARLGQPPAGEGKEIVLR